MKRSGNVQADSGLIREFDCAIARGLPKDLSPEAMQKWIGKAPALKRGLRNLLLPSLEKKKELNIGDLLHKKEVFYRAVFSQNLNLADLEPPEPQKGFDRLLVIAQGLTLNGVYAKCAERFPCWRWQDDLDQAVAINDRVPDETYALWIQDRVEADEELKNLSADALKKKGIPGLTLLERLVLELDYYMETGEHLDASNITLCAGSRCSDGGVPSASWDGGKFIVSWFYSSDASGGLRARAAVS